jgi:hypothetical protein
MKQVVFKDIKQTFAIFFCVSWKWGGGGTYFYVLLPYIIYVMQSRRFSQCPALFSRTAKERDKKYSVKSPQRYKK